MSACRLQQDLTVARTTKKRAKQLKHDKFRDTAMGAFDRLGDRLEGKGRTILYGGAGILAVLLLYFAYSWWSESRADKARLALGKAIEISEAPITTGTPDPTTTGPTFPSERERAQKAVEEFQKIHEQYGSPYSEIARFFAATNLLSVDRAKGISELEQLTRSGNEEVAARAKFSLAQVREADGQLDQAAALYQELLKSPEKHVAENTLNLRLATVLEKQEKKDAAVDILFRMVEESRKTQTGKDDKPATPSGVVRAATEKLQKLSPERYAQLPPEPATARGGFPSM
jgi:predicted negative regulator of RcsB-dependent stress response